MHDTRVVVWHTVVIHWVDIRFFEVVFETGPDVLPQNVDVVVTVGAWLLVVEADSMAYLMHHHAFLKDTTMSTELYFLKHCVLHRKVLETQNKP